MFMGLARETYWAKPNSQPNSWHLTSIRWNLRSMVLQRFVFDKKEGKKGGLDYSASKAMTSWSLARSSSSEKGVPTLTSNGGILAFIKSNAYYPTLFLEGVLWNKWIAAYRLQYCYGQTPSKARAAWNTGFNGPKNRLLMVMFNC